MHAVKHSTTAIFAKPFVVPGLEEVLPAGEYLLEAEIHVPDAPLPPEGFKPLVMVHLHPTRGSPGLARTLTLPLEDLEHALARDKLSGQPLVDFFLEEMLADPMVRLVMASDGVSEEQMRRLYSRAGEATEGGPNVQ